MRRIRTSSIAMITATALTLAGTAACSESTPGTDKTPIPATSASPIRPVGDFVGVTVPWLESDVWLEAFDQFPPAIEAAGWKASVLDAASYVDRQVEQIETFVTWGAKAIVVGAVDAEKLTDALGKAREAGILVLAYDGWGGDADAVDGVVQYQAEDAGRVWAQSLLDALEESRPTGPWTVELFAGDPESPSEELTYASAMEVLEPEISQGKLSVVSGETSFGDVSSQYFDSGPAKERMEGLLADHYDKEGPDGVLAPNSQLAEGIAQAFTDASRALPVIVSRGADDLALDQVRQGSVDATLAWPTSALVARTMEVLTAALTGAGLPDPDASLAISGKEVGVYAVQPLIVTKTNVGEVPPA